MLSLIKVTNLGINRPVNWRELSSKTNRLKSRRCFLFAPSNEFGFAADIRWNSSLGKSPAKSMSRRSSWRTVNSAVSNSDSQPATFPWLTPATPKCHAKLQLFIATNAHEILRCNGLSRFWTKNFKYCTYVKFRRSEFYFFLLMLFSSLGNLFLHFCVLLLFIKWLKKNAKKNSKCLFEYGFNASICWSILPLFCIIYSLFCPVFTYAIEEHIITFTAKMHPSLIGPFLVGCCRV